MSMFDDIANLFLKKEKPRDPESYDRDVYMINRMLSMEDELVPVLAEFSKYLWTLRGRYYLLLWGFMPHTKKKLWIKNIKRSALADRDRERVRLIQRATNYSGREAYIAKMILERDGVDIDKTFGVKA